ncbi:MAG TPA: arylsulfatase [Pirellulaceae bacterium]|jgi:arylsulfatase A-like enzyme|nr:arylsulfatase [Pirellulaceae bacterium]
MNRTLASSCLLLVLTAALSQVVAATPSFATDTTKRPNVLFIVSDDQGWNDVGWHNEEIRTPHLDALVKGGVELDCHYVMPQCTPTRVALMTGRYPSRFGNHACFANNAQAFPVGTLTLAKVFQASGYDTGMSGKWHLGSKFEWGPLHHGFDHAHGALAGAVGMYDHRYRLGSPFEQTWHRNHEWVEEEGHTTDLLQRETVEWIESHAKADEPWFFYVPFLAVHNPLVERDPQWSEMNAHIDDEERRLYAAAVSHMDAAIGAMVEALERTGQRDRTLIVFTSDNGAQVDHGGNAYPPPDPKLTDFSSHLPLRGKKTETYEGGYRVPAFANWPGKLQPRKVAEPMHVVDWSPTLAGLVGYELEEDPAWDGVDVWPLLSGKNLSGEPDSSGERTFYIVWGQKRNREALRRGDWKIVRNGGKTWELFNLADDPYEKNELSGLMPEKVEELLAVYAEERKKDRE